MRRYDDEIIEMPCESMPRRSAHRSTRAVIDNAGSPMPQAPRIALIWASTACAVTVLVSAIISFLVRRGSWPPSSSTSTGEQRQPSTVIATARLAVRMKLSAMKTPFQRQPTIIGVVSAKRAHMIVDAASGETMG